MTPHAPGKFGDPSSATRRQKHLQWIAWASIGLPLLAFGYLSYQSAQLASQVQQSRAELARNTTERDNLNREIKGLEQQRTTLVEEKRHYSELAGIKVVFYRREDSQLLSTALATIGLQAELRDVKTISKAADTLAYGPNVSVSDCKAVATALVNAGFALRRIAPATKLDEKGLLQIYGSAKTARDAPLYTAERIRSEAVCGPEAK